MPPATPRISRPWIDRPSSASGDLHRHQMRGFRIGDRDAAVGPEHDEAMRHGVERPVEALGETIGLLLLRNGGEQHIAHGVSEFPDGEQEWRRQQAQENVVESRHAA